MSHTTQAKREAQAADETEAHPCQLDAVERRIEEEENCAAILQQAIACRERWTGSSPK